MLITKRDYITPLLRVNWLKQLSKTINKLSLDRSTDQSENIQEVPQTLQHQPHNKDRRKHK